MKVQLGQLGFMESQEQLGLKAQQGFKEHKGILEVLLDQLVLKDRKEILEALLEQRGLTESQGQRGSKVQQEQLDLKAQRGL